MTRLDTNSSDLVAPTNRTADPARGIPRVWQWLTGPADSIKERTARRQAQLLSSLLFVLFLITALATGATSIFTRARVNGVPMTALVTGGCAVMLGIAYVLSRTRRHTLATLVALGALSALPFAASLASAVYTVSVMLSGFIWTTLVVLLGSMLLSQRGVAILAAANLLGLLLLPAFVPGLEFRVIAEPLFFLGAVSVVIWVTARHRTVMETDRLSELSGHNLNLQALRDSLEIRSRNLEANQRAIQVILSASGTLQSDELLNMVVNLIRDRFNLYHVQVYLVDDGQQAAVLRQSTGYAGQQLLSKKHQIPLMQRSLVTRAIHDSNRVLVEDVNKEADFLPNPLLPDTHSELAVPLKTGDRVIGVLDAQSRDVGFFDPDMVALFEMMTDQISLLLQNSESHARISQQSEALALFANQLSTAAEVARQVSTILDPDLLLRQVVELMQSRFGFYHVHIYLLDEATNDLVVQVGSGEVGQVLCERRHKIPLDREKSLVARAARSRKYVVANDTSLELGFMPNPLLPQTRSELAVPLVVGDKVLGVFDVQDDQINRFSQSDLDMLSTLAGQIATAMQNARLFEDQKRGETLIRESEARQRVILETSPVATFITRAADGIILYANKQFGELYGQDVAQVVGQSVPQLYYHLSDRQTVLETIQRQGFLKNYELLVRRADGSPRWVLLSTHPFQFGDDPALLSCLIDITERKQTEEALIQANTQVQAVLDAATRESIISTTPEGLITVFNTGSERMLGYSAEEMVGKQTPAILHLESEVVARGKELTAEFGRPIEGFDVFIEYARQGKYEERDWTYVCKDGTRLTVSLAVTALRNRDGNISGFLGVSRDITERVQIEATRQQAAQELRAAHQQLLDIIDFLPDATLVIDQDKKVIAWNRAIEEMTGTRKEDIIGQGDFAYAIPFYGERRPILIDLVTEQSTERDKQYTTFERKSNSLTGESYTPNAYGGKGAYLYATASPLYDNSGNLIGAIESIRNVTERKQAEAERERFTLQLGTAAEIAKEINAILEPDQLLGTVVNLLKERFDLYHVHIYTLDEAAHELVMRAGYGEPGRIMRERGHKIPLDRKQSLVARAARTRQVVVVDDVTQAPDFMPNPLLPDTRSEVAVPLVVGDRVLGVFDVQDDEVGRFTQGDLDVFGTLSGQIATALQNAGLFDEVQQTAERLREVDRLKSEFLANMSHELRTPLNSIIGYAEVMLMGIDGAMEPETAEDVQAIFDNGHHLLCLINDILDLAKIEAGRLTLTLEQVDLEKLLDEVKSNNLGLIHKSKKPIELTVSADDSVRPIRADRLRLSQILNNLVSNAVKFTDQGLVSLHAFCEDGQVCVQVKDTGIGICETDLDKVFDKFRQVDGSHARRAEGTGLGLAITRYLVEMHGGTIDAQSKLGEGSTFTLRLPLADQEAPFQPEAETVEPIACLKNLADPVGMPA